LAKTLPIVLVGRRIVHVDGPIDSVRTDDAAGMQLAVEHLVALGHEDIAHVDGGPGIKASDRRRGYRASMTRADLRANILVIPGGETAEAGRRAGTELLALEPRPTAVIAYNDDCAWGVMRAISDARLDMPEDISVVGYDGSQLSRLAPRELTTVRQDADAMARLSVTRAVSLLRGVTEGDQNVVLLPTMVRGETTGPRLHVVPSGPHHVPRERVV
jgi:DNA-binding LacI/PurR family transcriptional regulator